MKESSELAKPIELAFTDKTLTAETSQNQPTLTLGSLDDLPLSLPDGWLLQLKEGSQIKLGQGPLPGSTPGRHGRKPQHQPDRTGWKYQNGLASE